MCPLRVVEILWMVKLLCNSVALLLDHRHTTQLWICTACYWKLCRCWERSCTCNSVTTLSKQPQSTHNPITEITKIVREHQCLSHWAICERSRMNNTQAYALFAVSVQLHIVYVICDWNRFLGRMPNIISQLVEHILRVQQLVDNEIVMLFLAEMVKRLGGTAACLWICTGVCSTPLIVPKRRIKVGCNLHIFHFSLMQVQIYALIICIPMDCALMCNCLLFVCCNVFAISSGWVCCDWYCPHSEVDECKMCWHFEPVYTFLMHKSKLLLSPFARLSRIF